MDEREGIEVDPQEEGSGEDLQVDGEVREEGPSVYEFPVDQIPEEWQGKSAGEIRMLWNMAAQQLAAKNEQLETYKQYASQPRVQNPMEQAPKEPEVDLKELLYEDPEKAFDLEIQKRLRPYIQEYQQTAAETAFMSVGREYSDFAEHEAVVKNILSQSSAPVTPQTVRATYLMAKGMRALEAEQAQARKPSVSEKPSAPSKLESTPKLEGLEAEIATGMGMNAEEYFQYKHETLDEVEVPLGND